MRFALSITRVEKMTLDNDAQDILTDTLAGLEEKACIAMALAKEKQTNVTQVIYVDNDGNDAVVSVYGFRHHAWKSSDTLDLLAAEYLGDADYASVIAYFNGIKNEASIEAGAKIKIPELNEGAANSGNRIYAEPEKQDTYGADIMIGDSGDLAALAGDLKTISGKENLAQGIFNRLATASGKRLRLASYGIRNSVGDAMAVESYLASAITQTVTADPRVSSLDEITLEGEGDRLRVAISWEDINGEQSAFEGEI